MKRTDRELHIALGTLLNRVRVSNSWSSESFMTEAKKVNNLTSAEAYRFYKALVDNNYLLPGTNKRKLSPQFDVSIWRNEDAKIDFVISVINSIPDFIKPRGRKPKVFFTGNSNSEILVAVDEINSLSSYTAQQLVQELRNRGYFITCTRQITEEL